MTAPAIWAAGVFAMISQRRVFGSAMIVFAAAIDVDWRLENSKSRY